MENKKAIQEWLEALRSGNYNKGTGSLKHTIHDLDGMHDFTTYCCLGVLCEVQNIQSSIDKSTNAIYFESETEFLPEPLAEKLNISNRLAFIKPIYIKDHFYNDIVEINDSEVFNFIEIADIIEEQFKLNNIKPYGKPNT